MRIYISGPMSGVPLMGFPAFDAAADRIRKAGHIAISPADLDRQMGYNERSFEDGSATPEQIRNFLERDLSVIARESTAVAVLNGWEKSKGALAEVALARAIGIPVYDEYLNPLKLHIEIRSETHDHF